MADTLTYLQELNIIATGRMANTSELSALEASISANSGYSQIDQTINTQLNAKAASIGTVAMYQLLARQGLGLELTAAQANAAAVSLQAAGIDTWAKLLHWAADNQTALTTTLDNRADAAMHFRQQLIADGKIGLFSGSTLDMGVGTILQNIGGSAQSLAAGKQSLDVLSGRLTSGGVKVNIADGYIASAVIHADGNVNWWPEEDEYGTIADDNGQFLMPANVPAGRMNITGGIDFLTHKTFKGVLTAPSGSTVVSPLTTLVESLVVSGGYSMQEATANVRAALGLAANVDVMTYEPRKVLMSATATVQEKAAAMSAEKAILQVSNTAIQLGNAIDATGTNGAGPDRAFDAYNALAVIVHERGSAGLTIDLTDSSVIARVLAATDTGAHLSGSSSANVIKIVDASNTAVAAAVDAMALAKAATVTQGDVVDALINAVHSNTLDAAVAANTGVNLDIQIVGAHPYQIAPMVA